ncbi:MAG: hypothetical protein KBS47_03515 [Bacteroidales bacterium]|nr:hypothetical protein [Candidatus Equimonas enterica]
MTLRKSIAESAITLPTMVIIAIVAWALTSPTDPLSWVGLGLTLCTTFVMMEWNNVFQLLHIRSRLTSTSFLAMVTATPLLHAFEPSMVAALALLACYFLLFLTYQQTHGEGHTYYAFLCLSVGCAIFPPLLLSVPLLWTAMGVYLRNLTPRTLIASLLGLLTPLWLGLAAACVSDSAWAWVQDAVTAQWNAYVGWHILDAYYVAPLDFVRSHLPWLVTLLLVGLLTICGVSHYRRSAFRDKIRTRMYFRLLTLQIPLAVGFIVCYPDVPTLTLRLLLMTLAPFVAHYFAHARGRGADRWFVVCIGLLILHFLAYTLDLWTYCNCW